MLTGFVKKGIMWIQTDIIHSKSNDMLRWTVIFLIIAIVAAVFGFTGISEGAASIAKILFFIFIVLFLISLVFGRSVKK